MTVALSDLAIGTRRILLIEDNPGDARLVQLMLEESGQPQFDITHVDRIAAAWEPMRNGDIDCALVDLSLPDADGLEGIDQLREDAPELPIIVLTGRDDLDLAIHALQRGAQDYLLKGKIDSGLLTRAVRYAVERKHAEVALAYQAMHDSVTGLPNRTLFLDRLGHALAGGKRKPSPIGVLFIDLDRFKIVNDSLGHAAGDVVLTTIAQRLTSVLRPGDTVARFGGDEFTALCQDLEFPRECVHIAERLLNVISEPIDLDGAEIVLTASIGIAISENPDDAPETMIRNADAAMYRAKEGGRARWLVFNEEIHVRAVARLDNEVALRRSLERGEFALHYQPIVEHESGRLAGFEALIRWRHPQRGLVAPANFIGLAEEIGLISAVGAWVLEEACREALNWANPEGGLAPFVSVNVSPNQLGGADLVNTLAAVLDRTGLSPERLWLEVTESGLIADVDATVMTLHALRELGVKLAVDDFGTGYTTLGNLKRFPLDVIKIDQSFINGLGADRGDTAIVTAVIQLAHDLGLAVTAEGVETAEQQHRLHALRCDYLQGFHIGHPAPAEISVASWRLREESA
jgi:diguanylate cyclase (GGDEF)-like protein